MVLISLKPRVDIFDPGKFIFQPTMENYASIIKNAHILDYFANSAVVSVVSTFVSLVIGSFAAYGFARFNWKKRESTAFLVCHGHCDSIFPDGNGGQASGYPGDTDNLLSAV